ncbi:uncharacterized protein JCM6883_000664 [Sporobolomyces salmoneus]|uniref:uncharacterized protein n=1 Tax=Sporobolomyces salmoneus TaxID=183962 RepID=UPI003172C723
MWANLNLKSLQDKFQESLHDLESTLSAVAPPTVPPPPTAGSSQPSSPSTRRQQTPPVSTRESPARTNSGSTLPLSPTSLSNAQQSASQLADSALSSLRASLRKGRQSFDAARASLDGGPGQNVTSPTARRTTSMDSVRSQTDNIKERELEDRGGKGKGRLEELEEREEREEGENSQKSPIRSEPTPIAAEQEEKRDMVAAETAEEDDEDAWGVGGGDDEGETAPEESSEPPTKNEPPATDILLDLSDPVEEPSAAVETKPPAESLPLDSISTSLLDDNTATAFPESATMEAPSTDNATLPPSSPPADPVNPVLANLQQESLDAEHDLTADTPRPSTMGADPLDTKEEEIEPLESEQKNEEEEEEDGWDLPEVEGEEPESEGEKKEQNEPIAEREAEPGIMIEEQEGAIETRETEESIPKEEPRSLLDPLSEPFTPAATPPLDIASSSPSSPKHSVHAESSLPDLETQVAPPIHDADEVGPSDYPEDIEDLANSAHTEPPSSQEISVETPTRSQDEVQPVDESSHESVIDQLDSISSAPPADVLPPSTYESTDIDIDSTPSPKKPSEVKPEHADEKTPTSLDRGIELVEEQLPAVSSAAAVPESMHDPRTDEEEEVQSVEHNKINLDELIVEPEQPSVEEPETDPNREKLILDEAETVQEPLEIEQEDKEGDSRERTEGASVEVGEENRSTISGDVAPELPVESEGERKTEKEESEVVVSEGATTVEDELKTETPVPQESKLEEEPADADQNSDQLDTNGTLIAIDHVETSTQVEPQDESPANESTVQEEEASGSQDAPLPLESVSTETGDDSAKVEEVVSKTAPMKSEESDSSSQQILQVEPEQATPGTSEPPADPKPAESSEGAARERSVSVSQDSRFVELSASHEELKSLKSSLDSLLSELIPSISSIDDTEALGAELRNLKMKADMGMDEVRRMSGQLDQQKSRVEELRDTHRLEHQSQQSEIDALRDSLAARNASLEEANDKLAAADKSAAATRQEIVKAAEEYDKLKLVAKEEEEKRVKALSLLRALRQKLVKNEQEKTANDQELEKSKKAEKDALDTLKNDRARFDKEIVSLRTAHEAQNNKLKAGFERENQLLKERYEKEAISKRGQFELDAIHVKATQAKELSAKDSRIAQLEAAVKDLTKSRDQVFEEAQKKTEEIEATKADEETLRGRTTELEYELQEAKDRIAALADELDEVKRSKRETNRDDSNARKLLAETEARYESRIRELESRSTQLEKDRRETEEEMGRNMQDRLKEVERMRAALAQKDLDYAESVQNSQKRDAKIIEAEKAKSELEKRLQNLEEMLKSVKQDADRSINAEIAVREELGDRVQRAAELEARLPEVQAKESTLRSNNKTLREELRKLQSGVLLSEKQRHPGVGYFSSFASSSSPANGQPGSPEAVPSTTTSQVISPSASVSSLASAATGGLGGTARANGSADEALNFEYLRNVILQFLEKPEMRPHLISVLGVILHFTPSESRRLIAKAGH